MDQADIPHHRLHNQRVGGHRLPTPAAVVRHLGGIQAQDYHQALWAIALRTHDATLADVERSIATGEIVRTWPMRGTIHFVPPEDARWMLALCATRLIAADARRQGQLDLDERVLARCRDLFHAALAGGNRLTRSAMMTLLEDAGIETKQQRGYHILWHTAQTGLICLGPMQGKEQTFVLLDEWAPNPRELSREEGLADLAARYIASHGPATAHDLAWWSGLTVTDAKLALASAVPSLRSHQLDGKTYWTTTDAPFTSQHPPPSTQHRTPATYLLPGFDEYLLGYKDRSAVLDPAQATKIVPGGNGVFLPTIVVAGRVVGTWKRRTSKRGLDVVLTPFGHLDDAEELVVEAAERHGRFLDLPLGSVQTAPT